MFVARDTRKRLHQLFVVAVVDLGASEPDALIARRLDQRTELELRATLRGVTGRSTLVVTAGMVQNELDAPRFVTAFPG